MSITSQMPSSGGMPFLGASSVQAGVSNSQDVETLRKHGNFANLQVYAPANPRYRIMPANPSLGFPYPMAIVEMAIHSPSSAERYQVTPIWVALPSNVTTSNHRGLTVNNITATPLWNNLSNTASMFNAAFLSGYIGIAPVPSLTWDQRTDIAVPEDQLIANGKLDMSHVLVCTPEGFVPAFTYDHTVAYENPEIDYAQVAQKYAQADASGARHPLRPHPVMSSISGYAAVKIDDVPEFYQDSNVQLGLIQGTETDDRKRFSFVGHVYRDSRDAIGSHAIFEVQDNRRGADTSRAEAFLGSLQHGRYNEIEFHGSLRTFPIPKTNASVFRIQLTSWHIEGMNSRVELDTKEVSLDNVSSILAVQNNNVQAPSIPTAVVPPAIIPTTPLAPVPAGTILGAVHTSDTSGDVGNDIPWDIDSAIDSVESDDIGERVANSVPTGDLEELPE